jgi:predicted TIM-barrel fold metal-dependent hydrolase
MGAVFNGNFTEMAGPKVTRRMAFLQAGAALASPAAASGVDVIDVATHFYDTRRPQGVPWPTANQPVLYKPSLPDRYLRAVKPFKVQGVVAIEASPWLEDNLWLLNVADQNSLIKAVVGNVAPGHPDFRAALGRFAKHPLFRGIRVGAGGLRQMLDDQRQSADLEFVAERALSLDILINNPAQFADIARLAARLPALRIIVGHLPLDDATGMDLLREHPGVFVKVSGVVRKTANGVPAKAGFYKPQLDELWKVFGPQRVLFASNWPTCDLIAPYPTVYGVVADYLRERSQSEVAAFFAGNAVRVYRLSGLAF